MQPEPGVAKWVRPGERIAVQGRWIKGGMVYVGSDAPSANGYWTEPSLIDPDAPVDWRNPDWQGTTLDEWSSYDSFDQRSRAAYLEWLAGSRSYEWIDIGYVLIYFFGLERRLIVDIGTDLRHPDVPLIIAEIGRLVDIYGHDQAFSAHAFALLCLLETLAFRQSNAQNVPWVSDIVSPGPNMNEWQNPFITRLRIGKLIASGSKIPADLALDYLHQHPGTNLRTPAHRCPSEFDELFKARYLSKFPGGMKVRPPAHRLGLCYQPASHGFRGFTFPGMAGILGGSRLAGDFEFGHAGHVELFFDGIPDIDMLDGPIEKLWQLARECTDELDHYSRFIGKHPEQEGTAAAMCLLPDVLLDSRRSPIIDQLRTWTHETLAGKSTAVVPLAYLLKIWWPGHAGKLTRGQAKSLSSLLRQLGVGIEPDVWSGAPTPKPDSSVVLFPLPDGAKGMPSDSYEEAKPFLHLAAVVAGADGRISPDQRRFAVDRIGRMHDLDDADRCRAAAHIEFLATGRLGMYGVKGKVATIPAKDRPGVGSFLVALAATGGGASRREVTALEKMFGYLGLEIADVYRLLHELDTDDPVPVMVRGTHDTTRWTIPDLESVAKPRPPVKLDHGKVRARMAETDRVSALLSDIFVDDPGPEPPTGPTDPEPESLIEGLDGPHWHLLSSLTSRPEWKRRSAEEIADSFGLPFLEGALDVINEVSIEACGEPVVEGFDPVVLNPYAVKELS